MVYRNKSAEENKTAEGKELFLSAVYNFVSLSIELGINLRRRLGGHIRRIVGAAVCTAKSAFHNETAKHPYYR